MTANKLINAQLVLTVLIASQGIFYLMGAVQAFQKLSPAVFYEQRLALDNVIAARLKIVYMLALLAGFFALTNLYKTPHSVTFIGVAAATLLLLADMAVAINVSLPINKAFGLLSATDMDQVAVLQAKWLQAIFFRGVLSASALVSILFAWKYS